MSLLLLSGKPTVFEFIHPEYFEGTLAVVLLPPCLPGLTLNTVSGRLTSTQLGLNNRKNQSEIVSKPRRHKTDRTLTYRARITFTYLKIWLTSCGQIHLHVFTLTFATHTFTSAVADTLLKTIVTASLGY